jgi:Holliday junction DNA helicase RuvA
MISHLEGKILYKDLKFVVLDVGGVGYKIAVTPDTLVEFDKNNSEKISLWTHLAVREDSLNLYGFPEKEELDFFELLISISGIGPKTALGVLSVAGVPTLKRAISSGETAHLTKVSGIGRKIAEKIVLELKDKVGRFEKDAVGGDMQNDSDAIEALRSLGYTERDAREALKKAPKDIASAKDKIKYALKNLGK